MRLPAITWTRNRVLLAAGSVLAVIALVLVLVLGGGGGHKPAASSVGSSSTPAAPASTVPGTTGNPLTGTAAKAGRVMAIKISNVWAARPPTGLNKADVVYVVPIEAYYSRILAIYATNYPSTVGPVRSARETDLEILRQYGKPGFAYSGATPNLLPWIAKHARIVNLYSGPLGYERAGWHRTTDRVPPHNLYANLGQLAGQASSASKAKDVGFRFASEPPAGGAKVSSESVSYSHAGFRFAWTGGKWRVYMDGKAFKDQADGKYENASTVVIQYTKFGKGLFREYGKRPPLAHSVGHGTALVLRDGRAYRCHWSRPDAEHGTAYTLPDGKRMTFAPGQLWIVLASK